MKRQIAGVLFLLAFAIPGHADVLNVPDPYPTINAAVEVADPGDIVMVAAGTYSDINHLAAGDSIFSAVLMRPGVTIQGAGEGATIIDAHMPAIPDTGRVFHCDGVADVVIRDMTIRNVFASVYGAGVYCRGGSSVEIRNVTIEDCGDGGVIAINGSTADMISCTFLNNGAKQGGGVSIESGSNSTMIQCTLDGNFSPSGGGMFVRSSTATIEDCDFINNYISTDNGSGGGLAIIESDVALTDCTVHSNTADGSGGGLAIIQDCDVDMVRCVISNNQTVADYGPGGGIYCDLESVLDMNDCTVARNKVYGDDSGGAGIFLFLDVVATITQCTIVANENHSQWWNGGGIEIDTCHPTIEKSIIAFNDPGKGINCAFGGELTAVSCCDVFGNEGGDDICGPGSADNFSLDPLFCDLVGGNYRLQYPASPCNPGNHPLGSGACDGQRIGGVDPGCDLNSVDEEIISATGLLLTNRPNPFRPETTIFFELAQPGHAVLRVFDVSGREIRLLEDRKMDAGRHQSVWDGCDESGSTMPSGVYFYKLNADGSERTRSMVLNR